jgi:3-oxoadipate enol-lactonase
VSAAAKTASGLAYRAIDLVAPWRRPSETIVFVAGLGTTADMWSDWWPALAGRYRLVAADLRGFGGSTAPAGHRYTLDGLVDDLLEVAGAAQAGRFHLVGEALGGAACIALACRGTAAPLASLTVCNAPFRGASLDNVAAWRKLVGEGGVPAWSARMMTQRFHGDEVAPDAYRWYVDTQGRSSGDTLLALGDVLLSTQLVERLPDIAVPTLVLCGDDSPYVPVQAAAEMAAAVRGAELRVFDHARHGLPFSHAAACAEALADFLARRCPPVASA